MTYYLGDKPRRTVIDAGASYGWLSLGFAKHFETVKAFELRPDVYQATLKNMENLDNVEVFNYALSNQEGEVSFSDFQKPLLKIRRTGITKIEKHYNKNSSGQGYAYPLDHFNFKNVDCIKIDVEGHEMAVLEGAIKTIITYRPVLIVEISILRSDRAYKGRQGVINFLNALDYKLVDVRNQDFTFLP